MDDNSHATDRIVVVGSGFGVWMANRHVASGRWGDVIELRAVGNDYLNLVVLLRDGTEVSVNGGVTGFQSFVAAAEQFLPGMWNQSEGAPADSLLFSRDQSR